MLCKTDPDAAVARKGAEPARPSYHHHRVIDDAHGVITAVETTPGSIAENKKLLDVVAQHQANTQIAPETIVADHKYGTVENFVAGQQQGLKTHMGDVQAGQCPVRSEGILPESAFAYRPEENTYICPAGQVMKARRLHPDKRTWEYWLPKTVCGSCPLRAQCTRAKFGGRTIHRHEHQELLNRAREQSHSRAAKQDRKRRQEIMERSFADATNNHGFKRLALAQIMAAADSGLDDCGSSKHPHPAKANQRRFGPGGSGSGTKHFGRDIDAKLST